MIDIIKLFKMNKKAIAWETLAIAVIAIFVVFFVLWKFNEGGGKGYGGINKYFDRFQDSDDDGVTDNQDKCNCRKGLSGNNGCPPGITGEQIEEENAFKNGKCADFIANLPPPVPAPAA